jgi:glucose/arabinose dehydrogenase
MPVPRHADRAGPWVLATGIVAVAGLVLSGCGSADPSAAPNWTPKPTFSGEGYDPGGRQPVLPTVPNGPSAPTNPHHSGSSTPPRGQHGDPAVVATKLTTPTGIAILPDNTALVGERTTGKIVRVQPRPGQPVQTVRTLTGLSTVGGGGLLDLAISPNYLQDNLIFAYVTTRTDNRVVAFTLTGPVTTVIGDIPRGPSGNAGRIAFDPKGNLLIATGDAGHPALAENPHSLAGKILRVTDIGRPAKGNPVPRSPVYASGFHRSAGLCIDARSGLILQTGPLPGTKADPINQIFAGKSYGWPTRGPADTTPLTTLPTDDRAPGGCAIERGVLFATSLDGQLLLASAIRTVHGTLIALSPYSSSLRHKYGRLLTVVAAADGALWLTTSNRDGHGHPVPADERVLRIVPTSGGGKSTV